MVTTLVIVFGFGLAGHAAWPIYGAPLGALIGAVVAGYVGSLGRKAYKRKSICRREGAR